MREEIIRTKIREIKESIRLVEEHLPDSFEDFSSMGRIEDDIYKGIEFARAKLKAMKGFRNILVHRYGKIDDKLAFNLLKENLKDFYLFKRRIEEFLEDEEWRL